MKNVDTEVHPMLNDAQMFAIADFRRMVAYKTPEQALKLLYEQVKTGRMPFRKFEWCTIYLMKGF